MPNGVSFDLVSHQADIAKKNAAKSEYTADPDKDKVTPKALNDR